MSQTQQLDSGKHKNCPEHESTHYAAIEHLVMGAGGHLEGAKNQNEDEDIVNAQRFLYQVTSEEFDSGARSERGIHPEIENERQANPSGAFEQSSLEADLTRLAMKDRQVEDEGSDNYDPKNKPVFRSGSQYVSPRVMQARKVYPSDGRAQTDCFDALMVAAVTPLPDNSNWWKVVERRPGGSLNELPAL